MSYRSPQWTGSRFANPAPAPGLPGPRELLRWLASRAPEAPRDFRPPFVENTGEALRSGRPAVTWIGHATLLVQLGGATILTDPIFAAHLGFSRRYAPPGLTLDRLPPVDVALVSHNHRDHLDKASVRALGPDVAFVVPLGLAPWFRRRGLPRVVELDWWDRTRLQARGGAAVEVTLVPAQHWSRRGLFDENRSLWGGFVVEAGGVRAYFAGDTGDFPGFAEIGRRFPDLEVAMLPIGAYEPRWFMSSQHISPEQAAEAFRATRARLLVPMHWGTFRLSDEPLDEPPRLLRHALGDDERLRQLAIGETLWL